MNRFESILVSPKSLSAALQSNSPSQVVPVDCSWFMPGSKRDPQKEYQQRRIPHARFFDLDKVKGESAYPHMLPTRADFMKEMSRLGIKKEDHITVYDTLGIFSAPRVFWMLRYFGHQQCSILDGGFPRWLKEQYDIDSGQPKEFEATEYNVPHVQIDLLSTYEDVVAIVRGKKDVQIIDARPSDRFIGAAKEPRPDISSGHIPGSISIPFSTVVDPSLGEFLPSEDLKNLFTAKGIDLSKETVLSCGSGVTASALFTALVSAGHSGSLSVYDGKVLHDNAANFNRIVE
ncbi:putative 3-mercaptopyruvate sulfurtransferase [Neolecta irregularis DAH-3]|uniref:Putative 3-mercaptopyruvate sulfurtransferase n=1 Tax=Neolecta irregularis (strain DAH-3) TaxID=1198029 RepID=A0A1U7LNQ7_NEOID|nr:putative 3-mercaptopyruvate sulfurtransferase [Neolecta irregularis DAH-3]|eukprot:OLL24223.1 putative 3-mercaptopyruvate sulfurtransferase [Neolecta irregularis DAH-3]